MTDQCDPQAIMFIDREVYEHLGPLHQVTADILAAKGKLQIIEGGEKGNPARRWGAQ